MAEISIMTVERTRPALPEDGLCVDCTKNPHQYIKKNRYLCGYCWSRDESPHLAHLTDEQLDAHTAELRRSEEEMRQKMKARLINVSPKMGFN